MNGTSERQGFYMTNMNEIEEQKQRIAMLEKEIVLLKEILYLEEAIQIIRGRSASPLQRPIPPWAPEPIRFKD